MNLAQWLRDLLVGGIDYCLNSFIGIFNFSLSVLETEAGRTPVEFSATIVNSLQTISDTVLLPVAGLVLTYIFCYELINMVTEKNNMAEFDMQGLFALILRTVIGILLVANCFDICLAFFDVGQSLVQGAIQSGDPTISTDAVTALTDSIGEDDVGMALVIFLVSVLAMAGGLIATGLIYFVAWSRIVTILIYISVAPIPFATFMGRGWVGSIGENYLRNLAALALQGFLMVICMIIYAGVVEQIGNMSGDNPYIGLIGLLVTMFVCVKALMSCLTISKSIFGAH